MRRKKLIRILFVLMLLPVLLLAMMLSQASVELTEHGAHKRLLLPLGPAGKMALPLYGGTADDPTIAGFLDGPIVRTDAAGNWQATWFCEQHAHRAEGRGARLDIDCAGRRSSYPLARATIPPAEFAMPKKLAVLSDIEGNRAFLDAALVKLGVVDAEGNWRYGSNHLVIAGDSVDRGREVFAVLWRLYGLSLQAQSHGGAVHVLLGNHEQYILRDNTTRAHKEHLYALEQMGGHASAFGADTVIGAWLRAQPVVLKAGTVLVTHGGIAPEVAAGGFSVSALNQAMRQYWRGDTARSPLLDAVIGPAGVTQYRGYFEDGEERYARAGSAEVAGVLQHFGATGIVVGHTLVDRVSTSHDGQVYAVDVNANTAAAEVLVFEDGKPGVVDIGVKRMLPDEGTRPAVRPIALGGGADWRLLGAFVRRNVELSRLRNPY
ncbi:Bis(5'-nucleosyl)-tetraphosphatase, symmetrical [Massilia sp. Bi118]|uniref:metallophosphoesterase n=1 Tax=Massilia sp. Bi118 TaxID=2822346 RepID=UPI001DAB9E5E|nr:metallophosphoesterase [Massilia sp. Bi118]CAH0230633.1 Bis(5'-nucleosyl)-tetraphosphatase, symmetrical [Massilia sp. Bi118]